MTPDQRVSVWLAEDHPLFLNGLTLAVKARPDLLFAGSSTDGRDALAQVRERQPQVLVLDLRLPQLDGHAVLNAITRESIPTRVLVLSAHVESHLVYEALAAGASGFLSKLTPESTVCDGIAAVARGDSVLPQELQPGLLAEIRGRREAERPRLSEREQAVLKLLADGLSAPRIAETLHLSPATVRTYLQNLYEKLGVSTQAAAVAVAMRQGLLE
jgi:two-component system nitrate/nitrite response regulator NarL